MTDDDARTLRTGAGDHALHEFRLRLAGREWTVLHTGAILSYEDEHRYLTEGATRAPYGVALWPAAIALAHEVAGRASGMRGLHVLELGAGTGLPGIVAAAFGARVVQTDRQPIALGVCERNGRRNDVAGVEYRLADWTGWDDTARFDMILGSDVLYAEGMHAHLRRIFERSLAPGGRVLLSDPFRAASLDLLGAMEADGWTIALGKWSVGEQDASRPIGVYELTPPTLLPS